MKKLAVVAVLSLFMVSLFGTTQPAEAQVVLMSNQCCDTNNVIRCIQVNFTPVGSACFCMGQGYGHTC